MKYAADRLCRTKGGIPREFRTGKMRRSAGTNRTRRPHRFAEYEIREKHEIVRISRLFCQFQTRPGPRSAQNAQAGTWIPTSLHSTGKISQVSPAREAAVFSVSTSQRFAGNCDCSLHSAFNGKSLTQDCAYSTVPTQPFFSNRRFPFEFT